jgi:hypothetical protein
MFPRALIVRLTTVAVLVATSAVVGGWKWDRLSF